MRFNRSDNASASQILILAAAFALFFGLLEGAEICVFRMFPNVQAHEKVSADILYAAPVVHLALNLAIALVLIVAARVLPLLTPAAVATVFTFIGVVPVLHYSKRIASWGVLFLAVGIAVRAHFSLRTREGRLISLARRSLLPLAAGIAVLAVLLPAWRSVSEFVERKNLPPAPAGAPSVLYIVLDAVRADRMSCYGYTRPTTPFLDTWVREGVAFENAYAPSGWSLPSHSTLLTGRNLHDGAPDWKHAGVPKDHLQLPEALRARGYRTALISANKFFVVPELGFGRGFLHVDPYPFSFLIARTTLGRVLKVKLTDYNIRFAPEPTAGMVVDRFLAWQDAQQGAPFFALLNMMDAHEPYMPPPPYNRKFSPETMDLRLWRREARRLQSTRASFSDAYDEGVAYLDSQLQRLVGALQQRGRLQNTLIVILSDHGEAIMRAGVFDHGHHVYREQLHVPLILHMPGKVPAGLRVAAPVPAADVPATIAQLTGLAASQSFPGESLTRFWNPSEEHTDTDAMVVSELTQESGKPWFVTAFTPHWQYIINDTNGQEMLFDLRIDPADSRDLAPNPQYASILAGFRERLDAYYRAFPQWQPSTMLREKQANLAK